MTPIEQVITALPDAPNPASDSPGQFSSKAAAIVLATKGMVPELNTMIGQMNTLAGEMSLPENSPAGLAAQLASPGGAAGVGFGSRTVADKLSDTLNARDKGVVGNGLTDDWPAFRDACADAIARRLPLDIRGLKIYLASQSATIPSEGLYLLGDGLPAPSVNWDYMAGTNNQFDSVRSTILSKPGSAIISRYNGPAFTGKNIGGEWFAFMGDPSQPSNALFDTGTPTAYPGWSRPFDRLTNVRAYYCGASAFRCRGGVEVTTMRNVGASYSNNYGLHIHRTSGVDSPIEYLRIQGGEFSYGLLGNIFLDGVRKQITIEDGVVLNAPGQLPRRAAAGFVVASESDIAYPVRITKDPDRIVANSITVRDCVAEESQAIVAIDGLTSDVRIERNYLLPQNDSWPFYHAAFKSQAFNIATSGNRSQTGARFLFASGAHGATSGVLIGELADADNPVTMDGQVLAQSQLLPVPARAKTSGTLGDGSAMTATYSLVDNFPITAVGFDEAGRFAAFLVTSNFQATTDNLGAYLVYVTRLSSGNYSAIVQSTGATTGFTGAPTVSAAGVLSLPLAEYYRGRVTRLDMAALS